MNENERIKNIKTIAKSLVTNYFAHEVGKNAAALAYYFLFAFFPLLIFISNLLGLLDLNVDVVRDMLQRFLPSEIVGLTTSYLGYVSHSSSKTLLWFSLIFTVWFPLRAVMSLTDSVRLAYKMRKHAKPLAFGIRQLVLTAFLLICISLILLVSTLGAQAVEFIGHLFPETARVSEGGLALWQYLRFALIGFLMYAALTTLYAAALGKIRGLRHFAPGIAFSLVCWLIVSMAFSFYVENFAGYSVIYGTLGAVIMLLIWLYLTAVILIMGAELNAAIALMKHIALEDPDRVFIQRRVRKRATKPKDE